MKRYSYIGFIGLTLYLFFISVGPIFAADPIVTWKVQTPFSKEFWSHKAAQIWAGEVFKMSGGRMNIDLLETKWGDWVFDIHAAVQKGARDAAYTSPALEGSKFPAAVLFGSSPAFIDLLGYFTWMQAYGGTALLQDVFGNTVKVFPAGMCWGKVGMWGTKKIETLGDLKGKRIRTPNPFLGKIYAEEGASVVTILSPPDVIFALSGGTLDAADGMTPLSDMMIGFHKHSNYAYFPSLQMTAGSYCVYANKDKWDSLPADLKEVLIGACNSANAKSLTNWLLEDAKALKLLKDQGKVTLTKFPKKVQQEILDKFVAQYNSVPDPTFQKVWKSQKEFMKIYVPYMELQKVEAVATFE